MGIDITLFAEHRRPEECWVLTDPLVPFADHFLYQPEAGDPLFVPTTLDIPRNRALFDILRGPKHKVSGLKLGVILDDFPRPRGLPSDVSSQAREWHDSWGDVFGASWLTLAEIDTFDWNHHGYGWFREMLTAYETYDEVRLVFWFDA